MEELEITERNSKQRALEPRSARADGLGFFNFLFFFILFFSLSQELYYGCNLISERREGSGFS